MNEEPVKPGGTARAATQTPESKQTYNEGESPAYRSAKQSVVVLA